MTLLDRALTKAYSKSEADATAAVASPTDLPTARGWAPKLRTPKHTADTSLAPLETDELAALLPREGAATANPSSIVSYENESSARGAVRGQWRRIDPSHALETPATESVTAPRLPSWNWPPICERLLESMAGPGIRILGETLVEQIAATGRRCIAFTGPGRGAGRTSLMLSVAEWLVRESSCRLLLADLDLDHPQLAALLGLNPDNEPSQIERSAKTAAPVVTLIPDQLGLFQISPGDARTEVAASLVQSRLLNLRDSYDLLLLDAGPQDSLLDGMLAPPAVEGYVSVLRSNGLQGNRGGADGPLLPEIECLGVVETFSPTISSDQIRAA
ncbi:MAG: hypothetical protein ACKV0T_26270 [Planctomycetales bacterium]